VPSVPTLTAPMASSLTSSGTPAFDAFAAVAEAAGHHPDIAVRYNQVALGLISHDAGGITRRDAAMAGRIDKEFETK